MAKQPQPDSPLIQILHPLSRQITQFNIPDEVLTRWQEAQKMVAEAGGVHYISIDEATYYCLSLRVPHARRYARLDAALSYLNDYLTHPDIAQGSPIAAIYLQGSIYLEMGKYPEALQAAEELMSPRFDNRRAGKEALIRAGEILRELVTPDEVIARDGDPPHGWAEVIEFWTKRRKRSMSTKPWLSENPTMQELWDLIQRVPRY